VIDKGTSLKDWRPAIAGFSVFWLVANGWELEAFRGTTGAMDCGKSFGRSTSTKPALRLGTNRYGARQHLQTTPASAGLGHRPRHRDRSDCPRFRPLREARIAKWVRCLFNEQHHAPGPDPRFRPPYSRRS
jgi:hypothetical protein